MTTAVDRLHAEQVFHDRQARQRADTFAREPESFKFDDNTYLDHENWIRPAFAKLGRLQGLDVLDCGCGHGMAAVVMARQGARVWALDLSHGYVDEARQRAAANNVSIHFVKANAERLPFANASFDRIWGNAILHHLDLHRAGTEIARILRPGGSAVFCEPWGENPLLDWARRALPYAGKHRTRDELPLRDGDLSVLRAVFPFTSVEGYQLLGMARRVWKRGRVPDTLDWFDQKLLRHLPQLQRYCRYAVITLRTAEPGGGLK